MAALNYSDFVLGSTRQRGLRPTTDLSSWWANSFHFWCLKGLFLCWASLISIIKTLSWSFSRFFPWFWKFTVNSRWSTGLKTPPAENTFSQHKRVLIRPQASGQKTPTVSLSPGPMSSTTNRNWRRRRHRVIGRQRRLCSDEEWEPRLFAIGLIIPLTNGGSW